MSPLSLRRYRAERLLRDEFEGLRARVLASVRGRLRASGVRLDQSDLEACYSQAWQGLFTAMLEGQEIAEPSGWLVLVTFRRALDDHRSRRHIADGSAPGEEEERRAHGEPRGRAAPEQDLAGALDDRLRLRQLMEGLRGRLSAREREAAALCYLQGLSRAEAAAKMGLSEARMRKLMEGRVRRRPGVAGKVGALVEAIDAGRWCEEQGSLMRALAYGILDPDGERYRLATMHRRDCPACRAYVLSLRGLAAVIPPAFSPLLLGAGAIARAGAGAHAGGAIAAAKGAGGGSGLAAGAGAPLAGAGPSLVGPGTPAIAGALYASGAAGAGAGGAAGAAGGGWLLLGGGVGAKLAMGCLVVLGLGAGCLALGGGGQRARPHASGAAARSPRERPAGTAAAAFGSRGPGPESGRSLTAARSAEATSRSKAGSNGREFSPEQPAGGVAAGVQTVGPRAAPAARSALLAPSIAPAAPATRRAPSAPGGSAAEREFSPG